MIRQVGAGVLVILSLLLIFGSGRWTVVAQSGPAYELIGAVNQFRAQKGLPALQVAPELMAAAQGHAAWMAANHHYSHTGEGGSSPQSRANAAGYVGTVYENIEGGTNLTAQQAVYWWQQDSIHLNTMLLPHHVHVGAGFAIDNDQRLFVLMVGQPSQAGSAVWKATLMNQGSPTSKPLPIIPLTVSTPRADGAIIHIVQQGQTAWAIAARYGIAVADLMKLNNLQSGAVLHPGDSILIRLGSGQSAPATPTLPMSHVVQQGETLWTIAAQSGIPMDDLLALNHLTRSAILRPGDILILRQPVPTVSPSPSPFPTETPGPIQTPTPSSEISVASITSIAAMLPSPSSSPTALAELLVSTVPAAPMLTQTPTADFQVRQPPVILIGALIAGGGLVGLAAAGAIVILARRR